MGLKVKKEGGGDLVVVVEVGVKSSFEYPKT